MATKTELLAKMAADKEAGFMPGSGMLASSPVARFVGGVIHKIRPPASKTRLAFARSRDAATRHAAKKAKRSARVSREMEIRRKGKGHLLDRLRNKVTSGSSPVKKPGMGLGKKLLIGGGLLGVGATLAGAASTAKTRAVQPLAPPEQLPPGY